jgi:hypothetical protein
VKLTGGRVHGNYDSLILGQTAQGGGEVFRVNEIDQHATGGLRGHYIGLSEKLAAGEGVDRFFHVYRVALFTEFLDPFIPTIHQ